MALQRNGLAARLEHTPAIPEVAIWRLSVEQYSEPSGTGEQATYNQQVNYGIGDAAPLILNGQEVMRVAVSELGL